MRTRINQRKFPLLFLQKALTCVNAENDLRQNHSVVPLNNSKRNSKITLLIVQVFSKFTKTRHLPLDKF